MQRRGVIVMAAILAVLGAVFVVLQRPAPVPPEEPPLVWSLDPDSIEAVTISLPREGLREAFVRSKDRNWRFGADGPLVAEARWGLGVPLLLSGPRAARLIGEAIAADKLHIYGLDAPRIRIEITTSGGTSLSAEVGDSTPDGAEDYVRVAGGDAVYSVHRTFAEVVERLVREPPVGG